MEAWFLLACTDDSDLLSQAPVMRLERYTENRRDYTGEPMLVEQVDDLFVRAQIAFDDRLGAGAMIYLRKIFEVATIQAAIAVGIPTVNPKNRRIPFRVLLEQVDQAAGIIPDAFRANGYKLFGELSDVIHGESDETKALKKFEPCRLLVYGIVENIRNNQAMAKAIDELGWTEVPALRLADGGPL